MIRFSRFRSLFALAFTFLVISPGFVTSSAHAQVVYSNDFETNSAGFDVSHFETLPDGDGGVSTYLGRRTPPSSSAVLTVTGLTPGTMYEVHFELYIGGTWDGSLVFGPDSFRLNSSSGGTLVNATFRNGFPIGDPTPAQTYSDTTPLGDGGLFRTREGADAELGEPIYFFGRGAGNPRLVFTASAATETLSFSSFDFQGSSDEFFALDDVTVTAVDTVSINDVTLSEGNGGTTDFVFTVTLSNPAVTDVTINYSTTDGTATSPADYTTEAGTATINAGNSSTTITIAVSGDVLIETAETFVVNLTGATNAVIVDSQGLGTILNDDAAPAPPAAAPIPTVSEWGLLLLMAGLTIVAMRKA